MCGARKFLHFNVSSSLWHKSQSIKIATKKCCESRIFPIQIFQVFSAYVNARCRLITAATTVEYLAVRMNNNVLPKRGSHSFTHSYKWEAVVFVEYFVSRVFSSERNVWILEPSSTRKLHVSVIFFWFVFFFTEFRSFWTSARLHQRQLMRNLMCFEVVATILWIFFIEFIIIAD